jgi:phosphoenolpyruvate carboxykinase (ATP)
MDTILNVLHANHNLNAASLIEYAIHHNEGVLTDSGAIAVRTGSRTGRSPKDKFIVKESGSQKDIWWSSVNQPFNEPAFDRLHGRVLSYLQGKDIFTQDCLLGADPNNQIPIQIITESAWQSLFARQLFIRSQPNAGFNPQFTVISAPGFHAAPELDGTRSEAFIILNLSKRLVLIGGTQYAGEIKKSMFTVMHYLMPKKGVLSMHASVNVGAKGDPAIFFGLSGTGKTSLSADPDRRLVGDDEHGWKRVRQKRTGVGGALRRKL